MWGHVGFFGRISNTWSLIGTSWSMVKKDKEMLVFPLVSGLCLVLLMGSFGLGILGGEGEGWKPAGWDSGLLAGAVGPGASAG